MGGQSKRKNQDGKYSDHQISKTGIYPGIFKAVEIFNEKSIEKW
jgi:hypothetical protein